MMPDLTPTSAALARERTYRLFGQLYLHGLTPSLLALVRDLPGFTEVGEELNADAAAADHHRLFSFNLFPYQSIFLDPSGLLGGKEGDRVRQSYRQNGYAVNGDAGPDHVGHELHLLAFLCRAEREAWEDGEEEIAQRMRERQQNFLQSHLLPWIFPFALAVRQQEQAFFGEVADLTLALVYDHALELGRDGALPKPEAAVGRLPAPPALLEKKETGLKEIASYLVTPPYAGIFLSRDGIGRLGQELEIPRGFGDRQQTLVNLMRSAVQYDAFPALLQRLRDMIGEWSAAYGRQQEKMPELIGFCRPWQARVEETERLITTIQAEA